MKILIFGISGMLGSQAFHSFSKSSLHQVVGVARSSSLVPAKSSADAQIIIEPTMCAPETTQKIFESHRPDIVINCVGVIKQSGDAKNAVVSSEINTAFPHRLAVYCELFGARLIQISTDCVFTGEKGNYLETDKPDASDIYGLTKLFGEVTTGNAVTLRTSIIGHELNSSLSLIDWFLAQEAETRGFTQAIFSGLPTNELCRVIEQHVIPNSDLKGLYHVSVDPISKYDLLMLVAEKYEKTIKIVPDDKLKIDRSLNSDRFRAAAGYKPADWPTLIKQMYSSAQARNLIEG